MLHTRCRCYANSISIRNLESDAPFHKRHKVLKSNLPPSTYKRVEDSRHRPALICVLVLGVMVERFDYLSVATDLLTNLTSMGNMFCQFGTANVITPGYYTDLPERAFGVFFQLVLSSLSVIQVYYTPGSQRIYIRYFNHGSGSWGNWRQI